MPGGAERVPSGGGRNNELLQARFPIAGIYIDV